jgi:quercetin dioxygenase-like cupin family protein
MKRLTPKQIVRSWGTEVILEETLWYQVKQVIINEGMRHSLEPHHGDHSIIHVTVGELEVEVNGDHITLEAGDTISIPANALVQVRSGDKASYIEMCSGMPSY